MIIINTCLSYVKLLYCHKKETYFYIHFCLCLWLNFSPVRIQFWLGRKQMLPAGAWAHIFLINHFHLLNCEWKKKGKRYKREVYTCEEYNILRHVWDIISSYPENLRNLQSWLSGCLRHGTSCDRNGVSAALEDWSITLLKQRENISSTGIRTEVVSK